MTIDKYADEGAYDYDLAVRRLVLKARSDTDIKWILTNRGILDKSDLIKESLTIAARKRRVTKKIRYIK